MSGMDGICTTEALLKSNPELRILVLTSYGKWEKTQQALQAGARGYCLKDAPPEELVTAIRAVAGGGTYLGCGIMPEVLAEKPIKDAGGESNVKGVLQELTHRELDVLKLLAIGLGNKEIAVRLFVSEKTVKTHVANILQKLEVRTRTQAAIIANKHGLG